jgi:hypothetical protein
LKCETAGSISGTARLLRGAAVPLIGHYLREYGNSMSVFVIRTSRARL